MYHNRTFSSGMLVFAAAVLTVLRGCSAQEPATTVTSLVDLKGKSYEAATAPDYSMDTTGIGVQVDFYKIVTALRGSLVLTAGSETGDDYVVHLGVLSDTSSFDVVDTAYTGGMPVPMVGSPVNVAATSLLAIGVDLSIPVVRTVIVHRTDSGVTSYQVFAITFSFA
jgi:hypothetical protein